ncbi:MAG: hypothetical protein ABIE94_02415 [archaeon]
MRDPRKFLADVPVKEIFHAQDGRIVRNLYELLHVFEEISRHGFEYHTSTDRDDFLKWIEHSVKDKELACRLRKTRGSREDYIDVLKKRIKEHEKKAVFINKTRFFGRKTKEETRKYAFFILTISFIVLLCLVIFLAILQMNTIYTLEQMSYYIKEYQEESSIFQNYMFQEIRKTQLLVNNTVTLDHNVSEKNISPILFQRDLFAPPEHVEEADIMVYDDRVVIYLDNPVWAKFAASGSMLPVISENANSIEIVPEQTSDIMVGDIISFKSWQDSIIVHRVVAIGKDTEGWYAVTKGDNLAFPDPVKVRFEQVKSIVVAVIY